MKARLSVILCGLSIALTANATNVFTNGNFGTGDLTGWTVTTAPLAQGYPSGFYVTSAASTPLNGFQTVGPDAPSSFYAVSDDQGPESIALTTGAAGIAGWDRATGLGVPRGPSLSTYLVSIP